MYALDMHHFQSCHTPDCRVELSIQHGAFYPCQCAAARVHVCCRYAFYRPNWVARAGGGRYPDIWTAPRNGFAFVFTAGTESPPADKRAHRPRASDAADIRLLRRRGSHPPPPVQLARHASDPSTTSTDSDFYPAVAKKINPTSVQVNIKERGILKGYISYVPLLCMLTGTSIHVSIKVVIHGVQEFCEQSASSLFPWP